MRSDIYVPETRFKLFSLLGNSKACVCPYMQKVYMLLDEHSKDHPIFLARRLGLLRFD